MQDSGVGSRHWLIPCRLQTLGKTYLRAKIQAALPATVHQGYLDAIDLRQPRIRLPYRPLLNLLLSWRSLDESFVTCDRPATAAARLRSQPPPLLDLNTQTRPKPPQTRSAPLTPQLKMAPVKLLQIAPSKTSTNRPNRSNRRRRSATQSFGVRLSTMELATLPTGSNVAY